MPKKILFVLMIAVFLISACTPASPESTATPAPEITEEVETETENETALAGDKMPCSTVFDYETTAETKQYQDLVDQLPPVTDQDWIKGNLDAPITIVEYADFQCPACVQFSQFISSLLVEFPSSIRIVYRHLPLPSIHDKAYISAMAAEAAGAQGKFWEMHDLLFQLQTEWSGLSEEAFIDWALFQAEALELDIDQFETDLVDEEARANLEGITGERLAMGMNYTPFVVINDRVYRENKPDLFGLVGIYEFGGHESCPPWVIDPQSTYTARLDTGAGEIEIDLFSKTAPMAVNSFVFLVQNGWYDDVYFHRVVEGFVAQAGDPSGLGVVGPGYTFRNEIDSDLSFDSAGILGMANAGVDTNGSQFFITLAPATNLDGGYTIFGEVTQDSMAALDEIALRDPQRAIGFADATIIYGIEIIEN